MSRRFLGVDGHFLRIENLNLARGSTSDCSFVFVVHVMENKVAGSLFGTHNGSDGIGIRLNTSGGGNATTIQLHNNLSGRSPADQQMVGIDCFVGIVNDTGLNECRFYFGYSADSMVSLGSAGTALTFSGSAMPDALIGAINANGAAGESLRVVVDKLAIFYDTILTLDDIKDVAACGTALASSSTRYYTMNTGDTNETDHSPNGDDATETGTVNEFRSLCGSGESARKARCFDGVDDILDTGVNAARGSTHVTSSYAWVVMGAEGDFGEIYGFDLTERLRLFPVLGNSGSDLAIDLFYRSGGVGGQRSAIIDLGQDARGLPLFIAWVNDVDANRFRFYWGFTPGGVTEVDIADFTTATTAVTFDQPGNPSATIHIGGVPAGHASSRFFRGTIDTVGIEFDTLLELADLQARAACGSGAGTHYWEIDGTNPESNGATITGDPVVVDGICNMIGFVRRGGYLIVMM